MRHKAGRARTAVCLRRRLRLLYSRRLGRLVLMLERDEADPKGVSRTLSLPQHAGGCWRQLVLCARCYRKHAYSTRPPVAVYSAHLPSSLHGVACTDS